MKPYLIVTNNTQIDTGNLNVKQVDGDFRDVLVEVRDLIHLGWRPVTHPLPASIRMMYSPVRSVVLSQDTHKESYFIIDQAMDLYGRTMGIREPDYDNLVDYQLLDQELLKSSLADLSILTV